MKSIMEGIWEINTPYLTEMQCDNVRNFVYRGGDASLLYSHFFSPLAEFFLKFTPTSIAPNVITLLGLLFNVIPHVIICYYSWNLSNPVPSWVSILAGIGYFVYQVLDNMDGKQARRTKSSSPLGLLFDHGVDAFNVMITTLTIAACLRIGSNNYTVIMFLISNTCFYFATLEAYYVGGLFLPCFNGVSEGTIAITGILLFSGLTSPDFWVQTFSLGFIHDIQYSHIFVLICLLTQIPNLIQNVRKSIDDGKVTFLEIFVAALLFIFTQITILTLMLTSQQLISFHTRILIYTFGLMFSILATKLQISHITMSEHYKGEDSLIFISILLLFTFSIANYMALNNYMKLQYLVYFIFICLLLCKLLKSLLLAYSHLVYHVANELSEALQIFIFKIGAQKQDHVEIPNISQYDVQIEEIKSEEGSFV